MVESLKRSHLSTFPGKISQLVADNIIWNSKLRCSTSILRGRQVSANCCDRNSNHLASGTRCVVYRKIWDKEMALKLTNTLRMI